MAFQNSNIILHHLVINEFYKYIFLYDRYKDGNEILASSRIKTEIKTEGSYTLVIENVEQSDAGSYSVIASNEVNQSSQFFKMDVRVPPRITQGLEKSLEVLEGEKIILKVVASADPPPKVLW